MLGAGRWNGAVVAVKVVEHPMTSTAAVLAGGRESLLATSVAHPNVVRAVYQNTPHFCNSAEGEGAGQKREGVAAASHTVLVT